MGLLRRALFPSVKLSSSHHQRQTFRLVCRSAWLKAESHAALRGEDFL
jgi:hypothetical protein